MIWLDTTYFSSQKNVCIGWYKNTNKLNESVKANQFVLELNLDSIIFSNLKNVYVMFDSTHADTLKFLSSRNSFSDTLTMPPKITKYLRVFVGSFNSPVSGTIQTALAISGTGASGSKVKQISTIALGQKIIIKK